MLSSLCLICVHYIPNIFIFIRHTTGRKKKQKKQNNIPIWLRGNALTSMNVVALRPTRLVTGWVTVCGRVNHLGM